MQLTVESILVSSSKPMIKLTQLCWQMLTDPLLLITAGNNHVHWSGSGEALLIGRLPVFQRSNFK